MNDVEKRRRFIINFLFVFIIGGLIYVGFKYGLPIVSPLVMAWLIATVLRRPINYLSRKLKIKRSIVAVVILILAYLTVGLLLVLAGIQIVSAIENLFVTIPGVYSKDIEPYLITLFSNIEHDLSLMDPNLLSTISDLTDTLLKTLASAVSSLSVWVVSLISGFATSLPNTIIRVLITIISSIFMASEYDNVVSFVAKQFTSKTRDIMIDIKNYLINILWSYIKSYSLIMLITFIELMIGLTLAGVNNSLLIALIIAVFDILPVLGTGTIMIPWIIITLIQQNFTFAIVLGVIYGIVTVVRNIIEPKIVGSQVGLHPLVMLASIFIGAQLFGALGLFGLPILMSLLSYLNAKGTIRLFR
ncbi:MAG: sporulation integral membrane protein YtvI [Erysipelotrichaceae bacterium]|nr:sporulation integral membrane protein YtvI [Erysipelotrichaceae bacterium]